MRQMPESSPDISSASTPDLSGERDRDWEHLADQYGQFMRDHTGKSPSDKSCDANERSLGNWVIRQRKSLRANKLSEGRRTYLDRVSPGWEGIDQSAVWRVNADSHAAFMRDHHGRRPSVSSTNPVERRLGAWRSNQVMASLAGKLAPERKTYLDRVSPGWEGKGPLELVWRKTADEYSAFVNDHHGRRPSVSSTNPGERRLRAWRNNQVTALSNGKLPPERKAYLDRLLPGWEDNLPRELLWRKFADEYGTFVHDHQGRRPSLSSNNPMERRLGAWRGNQVWALSTGKLSAERRTYLDVASPEWEGMGPRESVWRQTADEHGAFVHDHHGRRPSAGSADPYEARLGRWVSHQRKMLRAGKLSGERKMYLDRVSPGWDRPSR